MAWKHYPNRNAFPPHGCGWNDAGFEPLAKRRKTLMTVDQAKTVCSKDPYCHGFVYEPETRKYWKIRDLNPDKFYSGDGCRFDVYVKKELPREPHLFPPHRVAEAVDHFLDFGFVAIDGAFDETVLRKADEVAKKFAADCGSKKANRGANRYEIGSITHKAFELQGLIASPVVLRFLRNLYNSQDVTVQTTNGIISFPGSDLQHLHIDLNHKTESRFHNLSMRIPPTVKMYAPLVDMDKAVGPTRFVPGSHLLTMQGDLPYGRCVEAATVLATCRRGACVLMDMRTWHAGGRNKSCHPRTILGAHYGKSDFKGGDYMSPLHGKPHNIWFGVHKALPKAAFERLDTEPKKVLRKVAQL